MRITIPLAKRKQNNRIIINVSGEIFETVERTLRRFPETILGDREKRKRYYCHNSKQYVIPRNRCCFGPILFLYQSNGILSCPRDISVECFTEECEFFEIPPNEIQRMRNKKEMWKYFENSIEDDECLVTSGYQAGKQNGGYLKSHSNTYTMASSIIIVMSILLDCIQTLEIYRFDSTSILKNPWLIIELTFNSWFLVDFLARFFSSQSKLKFLQKVLNLFDGLAVVPYFILFCFPATAPAFQRVSSQIMRVLRVFRMLRLSRHSKRLQLINKIMREWKSSDVILLLLNLTLLGILGASGLYYLEGYGVTPDSSQFQSIPSSLWWSIVTLTTVGYGDVVPKTIVGKLFGAIFMTVGITTHMLPVLIVADMYATSYIQEVSKF